jgi:hypothetical protein
VGAQHINPSSYLARYNIRQNNNQGGGGKNNGSLSFYDKWEAAQMQDEINVDAVHNLFYQFIYLLAMCENLYFSQCDSADNAYVYNSVPIRCGGHTQITMAAFIERLVAEYNTRKSNPAELAVFLKMFLHFPALLKENNMEGLVIDIREYVNVWFQYATIDAKGTDDAAVKTLFDKIKTDTLAKAISVQENLYGNDENVANYLYTVYPHGFFVLAFNSIEKKEVEPVIVSSAVAAILPTKKGVAEQNRPVPLRNTIKNNPIKNSGRRGMRKGMLSRLFNTNNNDNNNNGYATAATLYNTPPSAKRLGLISGGKKRRTKKKGPKRRTIRINRRKVHTRKRPQKRKTRHAMHKNK